MDIPGHSRTFEAAMIAGALRQDPAHHHGGAANRRLLSSFANFGARSLHEPHMVRCPAQHEAAHGATGSTMSKSGAPPPHPFRRDASFRTKKQPGQERILRNRPWPISACDRRGRRRSGKLRPSDFAGLRFRHWRRAVKPRPALRGLRGSACFGLVRKARRRVARVIAPLPRARIARIGKNGAAGRN